jgi:AraC family transcriptional regulator
VFSTRDISKRTDNFRSPNSTLVYSEHASQSCGYNRAMTPNIQTITEKKLVGERLEMSLSDYKIGELWRKFMPRRAEITNNLTTDLISIAVYTPSHFENFSPNNKFERWATVEVADFQSIPSGMETLILPGGLYAVFNHKGISTDHSIFEYIFGTWLPSSKYNLEHRPHFEVLGEKYKNNDPNSEEEIWIPIRPKNSGIWQ